VAKKVKKLSRERSEWKVTQEAEGNLGRGVNIEYEGQGEKRGDKCWVKLTVHRACTKNSNMKAQGEGGELLGTLGKTRLAAEGGA